MAAFTRFQALLALVLLSSGSLPAHAATDFHVYSDHPFIDGDCGATFANLGATLTGFDRRIRVRVGDTLPPVIEVVEVQACAQGGFGAAQLVDAGIPVGLENGTGGGDVVEFQVPLASINGPIGAPVRLAFAAIDEASGSEDLLATVDGSPGAAPIVLGLPTEAVAIPLLSPWVLIALAALMALAAVLVLRRHPGLGVALLMVAGVGVAWAAHMVADGQVGDWTGIAPLATDPQGDSVPYRSNNDMLAAFGTVDEDRVFFRIDVVSLTNTPPVANPQAVTLLEDSSVLITLSGSDADGDPITLAIATQPTRGTLQNFQPDTPAPGQAQVTYVANADEFGADSFTFVANDGQVDSTPATVLIDITPVNDPPSFTAVDPPTVLEDAGAQSVVGWATFSPGPPNESGQAVLGYFVSNVSNPGLFAAPPAVATNGTLSYTPADDAHGTSTFDVFVQDDGGTANGGVDVSPTQTFTITVTSVNDAPTFTAGPDQTVLEDAGPQLVTPWATAISPGPPDEAGQTVNFNVTNNSNPALFSAGPAVTPTGALSYTPAPDANGSATVTLVLMDNGGTANGGVDTSAPQTFIINVTPVNDEPSFVAGPDQVVNEDAGPQVVNPWATAIDDGDPEVTQGLTFLITNNTNPALFAAGPSVSPTGVLSYTTAADANGVASITIVLMDDGGTANGGVDTSPTQTFTITVNAVNDAPVNSVPGPQSVDEDTTLLFDGAATINVSDIDIATGQLNVVLEVNDGELEVTAAGAATLIGNGSALLEIEGTLADVNATLASLSYTPDADFNGSDSLSLLSNDNGNTGSGGPQTDLSTVEITINPINDAPVNTVPGDQIVSGGMIEFSTANGNAISVFDVDAGTADIQVDLSVADGTLTALPFAEVTISNNGSAAITLLGTQDGINVALDGLIYTAAGAGTDTLVMISDDLGNSGAGGPLTDTSMVTLLVDEAPSVTASTPAPGDTTANNVALSISFSEAIDAAVNYATLTCGGPNLITAGQSASNVTVLTPTYTGPLPNGANCTLTILAANITDVDTIDPPDNMEADYVVNFTVDAAPEVNSTLPANGATDVALSSTITVNFSEAVDVAAGGITLDCDGPISFDAGPLPAGNVTSVVLTPSSPLPATTVCNGSVIATSVTDVDLFDPPDQMQADFNWSFTTLDLPPEVVSTAPTNGAVDVNPSSTITIDFSESVNFDTTPNAANTSFDLECPAGSAVDFSVVTASPAVSVVLDPVDNAVAGANCTLTVLAAGITDADLIDPPDNMLADFSASFSYGALANDDAYTVTPHLTLGIGTATPQGGGVLANDLIGTGSVTGFGFTPACTGTAPGNQLDAGAANGRLTLNANGSFSYEPPAGVANATRTFCYTVTGGNTANVAFTLQNTELVWFVNAAAAGGGIGNQARPFQTLGAAAGVDTANDTIHLAFNASSYTGGITLEAGERLIGSGSGSDLATITGITPVAGSAFPALGGSAPTITCTDVSCLTLATGNLLRGFIVGSTGAAGTGIAGTVFGTLTVAELTLNTNGRALNLTTGTLNGNFVDIDVSAGSQQGIALDAVGGTWTVTNAVSIGNVGGTAINLINTPAGGSASFLAGVTVNKTSAGSGINLNGNLAPVNLGATSVTTGAGAALTIESSSATTTIPSGSLGATGGPALNSSASALAITLASASSTNSATQGINLNNVTGTLTINGGAISGSTGTGFQAQGTLGGGVSYAGSISKTSAGRLVDVSGAGAGNLTLSDNLSCTGSCGTGAGNHGLRVTGRTGGTLTFSGANKVFSSSATNPGVSLTSNTGATLNFTGGGLAITTTSGAGFEATGGGTVSVQGAANTIVSTTGTALNVVNTSIGASGLNFRSIASNGGTNGIVLNNTGVAGGLTVTGVGTTAGSGGTIQNKTDDGVRLESTRNVTLNFMNLTNTASVGAPSATCGTDVQGNTGCSAAIDMQAVANITLNGLNIAGGQQYGINGNGVAGFSLTGSTISNSGNQIEEDGIRFINLTGTSLIRNTTVQNSHTNNLRIYNTVAAPLTLTIDETVAGTSRFLNALFNDGILFQGLNNANMTLSVSGTDFDSSDGDHIQTAIDDTATMGIIIMNNVMSANADPTVLGSGITLSSSADFNGLKAFNISNNTINGANAKAININLGTSTAGGGTGTYEGVIINNVIGTNGVPESGGAGIDIVANGGGTLTAQVTGNTVQQFDSDHGIRVLHRDGNGRINANVTSNVVRLPEPGGFNGVSVQGGATSGPPIDSGTICLDFSGNTMAGSGAGGGSATDFRLRQRFNTIFQLRGYAGLAGDTAAVVAYVQGINPGAESGSATVETIPPTGSGFINTPGGAACPLP